MFARLAQLMRAPQHRPLRRLAAAAVISLLVGGLAFSIVEGVPIWSGLYWATETATTVGYGDITPTDTLARAIAVAVMLVTIPLLAAVFALATGAAVSSGLRRVLDVHVHLPADGYRLAIGDHPSLPAVIDELVRADDAVILVTSVEPAKIRDEIHCIVGDPTSRGLLERARPHAASHALIASVEDGDTLVIAVLLRQLAPDLQLSAVVHSPAVADALEALGVSHTISLEGIVAHTLAKSLETPHAGDLLLHLVESDQHRLVEQEIAADLVGRTLSSVRAEPGRLVLGVVHNGDVTLGVTEDPVLAGGDRLMLAQPIPPEHRTPHRSPDAQA